MSSVFAWLDADESQQRAMDEMLELFKEKSSVDELGLGVVRDAIANALFPGTSVAHSRLRYVLFTAWIVREAAGRRLEADRALARLRTDEVRLIDSLLRGGETTGVFGAQIKGRLKTMPSRFYWASVGRLGLRTWDLSIAAHLRAASARRNVETHTDDDASGWSNDGFDRSLPPMPKDLFEATTFGLSVEESGYLRDRIANDCKGTLLAWLAIEGQPTDEPWIWRHPQLASFPARHRRLIEHGRMFADVTRGAPILYNLMLAERAQEPDLIDRYRRALLDWEATMKDGKTLEGWDVPEFWQTMVQLNSGVHSSTQGFVNAWLALTSGGGMANSTTARELIATRERRLKGQRARLDNPKALDAWNGESGLVPLDYRWQIASRHLNDLYAGLGVA